MTLGRAIAVMTMSLASSAGADGLALDLAGLPAGLVAVYQEADGDTKSHHFVGPTDQGYQIDFHNGDMRGSPWRSLFVDESGNVLRAVDADGGQIVFAPHDCSRTMGRCRFAIATSDGTQEQRTSFIQVRDGAYCQEIGFTRDGVNYEINFRRSFGTFGIKTLEADADEFCRPRDGGDVDTLVNSYVRN